MTSAEEGPLPSLCVGLIADPGLPADIAQALARTLPDELTQRVCANCRWQVEALVVRLVADAEGHVRLPTIARAHRARRRFDFTVFLTDHPRRSTVSPIVGEADITKGVALAVLPALGALRMRARARDLVVRLIAEMAAPRLRRVRVERPAAGDLGPFRRVELAASDDAEVRFIGHGPHARLRLLAGMVRANRPWRLVPSLSGAFATALGAGGVAGVTPTVWAVGIALGPSRLGAAGLLAVLAMAGWLIFDHRMWERPSPALRPELSRLYNAATVSTVTIGVVCLYVGLVALGLGVQMLILPERVLAASLARPVGLLDRFEIAWLVASLATVGGALGTGFESDEAVRLAAYGFRQRERQQFVERTLADYAAEAAGGLDVTPPTDR